MKLVCASTLLLGLSLVMTACGDDDRKKPQPSTEKPEKKEEIDDSKDQGQDNGQDKGQGEGGSKSETTDSGIKEEAGNEKKTDSSDQNKTDETNGDENDVVVVEPELAPFVARADATCPEGSRLFTYAEFKDKASTLLGDGAFTKQVDTSVFENFYLFWYMSDSLKKPAILAIDSEGQERNTFYNGTDLADRIADVKGNLICK